MAHFAKHTITACGHLGKHYERGKDHTSEYIKYGNESIDSNKTHLNYNLAPEHDQMDFIKNRISEVKCLKRKDVNVMCSWVVTLPKDYSETDPSRTSEEFFKGAYNFLEQKYGKENVVSSYVHMDETTPHMHFAFVPVVKDEKKGHLKVSAKECVTKWDLKGFHELLQDYLQEKCNLHSNVINEATKEGNKSIAELKRGTATQKLQEALREVEKVKEDINTLEGSKIALEGKIKDMEGKILSLEEVNQIKIKKPLFGKEKTVVQIPYEDAINLKATAQKVSELESIYNKAKELSAVAKEKLDLANQKTMKQTKDRISLEQRAIKAENKANKVLSVVNKALDKCPTTVAETFIKAYKEVGKEQKIHKQQHER